MSVPINAMFLGFLQPASRHCSHGSLAFQATPVLQTMFSNQAALHFANRLNMIHADRLTTLQSLRQSMSKVWMVLPFRLGESVTRPMSTETYYAGRLSSRDVRQQRMPAVIAADVTRDDIANPLRRVDSRVLL